MSAPALEVAVRLPLDRFELAVELTARRPVTGIFGPSGAGKTSLLEAIAGLRRPARGRIRLGDAVWQDSKNGRFVPPERRRLGYVPQDALLFPHLDVRRNLLAGAGRGRRRGAEGSELFDRVCSLLELGPLLARGVEALSGGERRRVALGRALVSDPGLLLLDEPLASLDLPLRRRLLPFLERLRSELTVPMLLVSHDPFEIEALCDEVAVLAEGRIVARGEPHRVLTDPAVFPLAAAAGLETVLTARLLRHEEAVSVLELGKGIELVTARARAEPGEEVLVGLPWSEVVLASERPRGLSARNVLAGTVHAIRTVGHRAVVDVELEAGLPPVAAEVIETTPAALGLDPGAPVYVVIKATSCRLYG